MTVRICDLSKRVNSVTGGGVGGTANRGTNTIEISRKHGIEFVAEVIVHECVHLAFGPFPSGSNEWITSTLTARLKPSIAPLAASLMATDNKNRAYIAHRLIAYEKQRGKQGDGYNKQQREPVGTADPASERRKERKRQNSPTVKLQNLFSEVVTKAIGDLGS